MSARWIYVCVLSVMLAACGGGGGSDGAPNPSEGGSNTGSTPGTGGSGSGSGTNDSSGGSSSPPTGGDSSSGGTGGSSPPSSGGGTDSSSGDSGGNTDSPPTSPSFSAELVSAPPEVPPASGEYPDFVVSGTNLGNVELVSAKDDAIIYGRFTISADRTRATLEWDYSRSYDGRVYDTYLLRVLAWDAPPGEGGRSIEVMPPRTFRGLYNPGCRPCGGEAP